MSGEVLRRFRDHVLVAYLAIVGGFAIAMAFASCVAYGWSIDYKSSIANGQPRNVAIADKSSACVQAHRTPAHHDDVAVSVDADRLDAPACRPTSIFRSSR